MVKLNIIEGYNHVYDTREKRNGGGVSIYIDWRIAFKKRFDYCLGSKKININILYLSVNAEVT